MRHAPQPRDGARAGAGEGTAARVLRVAAKLRPRGGDHSRGARKREGRREQTGGGGRTRAAGRRRAPSPSARVGAAATADSDDAAYCSGSAPVIAVACDDLACHLIQRVKPTFSRASRNVRAPASSSSREKKSDDAYDPIQ